MTNLELSKTLGGIGAILMFIGIFPFISYFGIVELIGAILVLTALYSLGKYYKDSGIFNNALYGIMAGIVGVVSAVAIGLAIVLPNIKDFLMTIFPSWNGDWSTISSLSGMTPNTSKHRYWRRYSLHFSSHSDFRNPLDIRNDRNLLRQALACAALCKNKCWIILNRRITATNRCILSNSRRIGTYPNVGCSLDTRNCLLQDEANTTTAPMTTAISPPTWFLKQTNFSIFCLSALPCPSGKVRTN